MFIKDIFNSQPKTISADLSIENVVKKCIDEHVNGYVVVDDKQKVLGIISLQDVAGATVPSQFKRNSSMAAAMYKKGFFEQEVKKIKDLSVSKIMRKNFVTVNLEDNIMVVMADFLKNDLYIIPVLDQHKKLVGIITRSEIKHALAMTMGLPSKYSETKGQ